jgi:hypothetical protein
MTRKIEDLIVKGKTITEATKTTSVRDQMVEGMVTRKMATDIESVTKLLLVLEQVLRLLLLLLAASRQISKRTQSPSQVSHGDAGALTKLTSGMRTEIVQSQRPTQRLEIGAGERLTQRLEIGAGERLTQRLEIGAGERLKPSSMAIQQ